MLLWFCATVRNSSVVHFPSSVFLCSRGVFSDEKQRSLAIDPTLSPDRSQVPPCEYISSQPSGIRYSTGAATGREWMHGKKRKAALCISTRVRRSSVAVTRKPFIDDNDKPRQEERNYPRTDVWHQSPHPTILTTRSTTRPTITTTTTTTTITTGPPRLPCGVPQWSEVRLLHPPRGNAAGDVRGRRADDIADSNHQISGSGANKHECGKHERRKGSRRWST